MNDILKLHIDTYTPIDSCDVELPGISVITGDCGTGKSTLLNQIHNIISNQCQDYNLHTVNSTYLTVMSSAFIGFEFPKIQYNDYINTSHTLITAEKPLDMDSWNVPEHTSHGSYMFLWLIKQLIANKINDKSVILIDDCCDKMSTRLSVEFARVLIELVKHKHCKVVLTTYIPDFVDAIYSLTPEDMEDQVNFYLSKPQYSGKYFFKNCEFDTKEIFDEYNKSFGLITHYGCNR